MSYKLLLADDSVTIQRVIELTFADEDIEVIAVGDGQQAIERIGTDRPDIVLADAGMPERDGFEVAAFVKNNPELCHIPVLLLTGAFEPVDENRLREAGCDGVLAKPFEPQLLIARVKELLATPPGERKRPETAANAAELDRVPLHEVSAAQSAELASASLDGLNLSATEPTDSRASVDEYFDRLDAAFATATGTTDPARPASEAARLSDTPSWIPTPAPAAPERSSSAQSATAAGGSVLTGVSPEIAAAFDWLLAEEQGQPLPPEALTPSGGSRTVAIDTIVEEVTRRVIERLADRAVRQAVADVVSEVAERLVRDEIERLKAGLK